MAVKVGEGLIEIRADASGLESSVRRQVGGALDDVDGTVRTRGKGIGGSFGGGFLGGLAGTLGPQAIAGAFGFLKDGLEEAVDKAKIGAIVTVAIRNAGAEARGLTKAAFDGVAAEIGKALVIDDDDIARGLAPLLRVPELGKDAFDRLARIAADASAATGKDLEAISNALSRLATAPDEAIGALRGLGIQVDQTTKDTVKFLVEQGKAAEALNVILEELNKRYEGTAEAVGKAEGPVNRLSVRIQDLKERIGTALLPVLEFGVKVLEAFVGGVEKGVIPAFAAVFNAVGTGIDVFRSVIDAAADVGASLGDFFGSLPGRAVEGFGGLASAARNGVGEAVQFVADLPARLAEVAGDLPGQLFGIANRIFDGFIDSAVETVEIVVRFFRDLPGAIVDAIGDLGGLLFEAGRNFILSFARGIADAARAVRDAALGVARGAYEGVKDFFGFGSPSRLMISAGRLVIEGLEVGLRQGAAAAEAQARAGAVTTVALNFAPGAFSFGPGSNATDVQAAFAAVARNEIATAFGDVIARQRAGAGAR